MNMELTHAKAPGRKAKQFLAAWRLGVMLLVGGFITLGCSKPHDHSTPLYWCPMHPEVTSADPNAECDKCGGMKLLPKEPDAKPVTPAPPVSKTAKFFCPMHPAIVSDKKGSCPICSMDLVPIKTETDTHTAGLPGLATVSITPEIRQRMGLTVGAVEKRALAREVRTSARLVADETRLFRVTTKIEGWVEKLFVNVTGQEVKQGDPLLTIYSPELVAAQEEFLIALRAKDTPGGDRLVASARRRLELWDISEAQITQLEKTGKAEKFLALTATASGVVIEKNILSGQRIMPGEALLAIADLSVIWADADLYQSDLPHVSTGIPVTVTLPDWSGKVFKGKVSFITPTIDPVTRTARARLEIENPDRLLKPGMYANARLAQPLGEVLAIPETAVMRTGDRTYAFQDGGDGKLIPVIIQIGARSGGYFELVAGLQAGDRVVTSANFLVDSESSLKAALAGMSGERSGEGGEQKVESDPHAGHRR